MSRAHPSLVQQRGVALVTSLLLLIIITILALSMFRTFGTQEKIAGNLREKERALHAATSAQQYAEWWLLQNNNALPGVSVACAGVIAASPTQGQICNTTPQQQLGVATMMNPGTTGWATGMTYAPTNMTFIGAPLVNGYPPYFATPMYWITDLGGAADAAGEAYQVDAYGYGSASSTVAIVESFYEVSPGVSNLVGP
jgi:type IV pilus assembly protein PilX